MKLEPIELDMNTDIQHSLQICRCPDCTSGDLIVIGFAGTCRPGSEGCEDYRYMRAIVMAVTTRWSPLCLVLDFRDLAYVWGAGMGDVFDAITHEDSDLGAVLAVSEKCRPSLLSLCGGPGSKAEELMQPSLEEAMGKAHECAREYLG